MMFGIGVVEQSQLAGAALTRFATPQPPVTDDVGLEQALQIFGLEPAQLGRDDHGRLIGEVVLDDDGVEQMMVSNIPMECLFVHCPRFVQRSGCSEK